ncbi:wax ester/triacylglycerol synthase family O-acyltransferase [Rhodococcus sp. D2-41]|uniref:WS/DGAT/MGAT family O-acyltransferase n=1 Tax=Speluncibacter jeojiensis TaxID=2710754 RepID=UPI00240F3519|nr:wax ester/triacylglycerol synthase family O-acyltransferase [Rhodococcus sp. D2-41]MDG3011379.1 wax ester/triacylglycerol synthase family O-acyltransferase [Rhodococcus sp. D2-41]
MERLSGLDASFLYLETPAQLLHVCGLIEVDGGTIDGGYTFAKLKKELAQRVRAMPGFRRKLQDSFLNLDHPVWVEDKHFDIDQHLHRIAVPAPGGPDEVAELCAHIAGQPLDRTRPLWEMWVIEGLGNGHIAVMSKMHHATVDGVSGANMMSQLCTLTPAAPPADEADLARNAGDAGTLGLAVDGMLSFAARPLKLLQMLPGTAAVLPKWISRSRHGRAMPAPFTAPRTSFNGTITGHREIAYTQVPLDDVKEVKNAFGCKLNDVVLAVCSGALRKYLDERNELPDTSLVAMVPVSVHGKSTRPGTNQVTGMFTTLRTDVDDPARRLAEISAHNLVAKEHKDALPAGLLQDAAQFAGPALFGAAMRAYASLRLAEHHPVIHNLVISNVPGPPVPLYFMGARIEAMYPLGPVFHGAGLNITVFSLDGELNIGLIGCRELTSTLWPLAQAMRDSLADLLSAARAGSDQSGTAPRRTPPAAQE